MLSFLVRFLGLNKYIFKVGQLIQIPIKRYSINLCNNQGAPTKLFSQLPFYLPHLPLSVI